MKPAPALVTSIVLGSATAAALLGVACYDIDGLRGGVRPGTATSVADADAGTDAQAPREPGFCDLADGSLFCDDFDQPDGVPLEERWNGYTPIVPGVLIVQDASVTRGPGTIAPRSSPSVLRVSAETFVENRTVGMVVATFPALGSEVRALELSADVHAPALISYFDGGVNPKTRLDAGEDPRSPFVSIAGLGASVADPTGATMVLSPGGLLLRSGVQGADTVGTARQLVARYEYAQVLRATWLRITVVVGERAVVDAHVSKVLGVAPSCPSTPAVAAGWAAVPTNKVACITIADSFVPLGGKPAAIVLGASYDEPARVRVELDNVLLRGLP